VRQGLGQETPIQLHLRQVVVADTLVVPISELLEGRAALEQARPCLVQAPGRGQDAGLVHPDGGGDAPVADGLHPSERLGE